ncbi:MAG: hypothetical protein AAF548_07775, partial [Actinomycetota bacterium]
VSRSCRAARETAPGARDAGEADGVSPTGAYAAATCVGAMGNGHLEPRHVPELVRAVKPGGPVVVFMNGHPYVQDDYASQFEGLEREGVWTIERTVGSNYMDALVRPGFLVVARAGSEI